MYCDRDDWTVSTCELITSVASLFFSFVHCFVVVSKHLFSWDDDDLILRACYGRKKAEKGEERNHVAVCLDGVFMYKAEIQRKHAASPR